MLLQLRGPLFDNRKVVLLYPHQHNQLTLVSMRLITLFLIALTTLPLHADDRQKVEFPPMMRDHMLANMRDHLLALQEITAQLSAGDYDRAADIAESRLGMSSLESHGAAHMARVMPDGMAATGTAMHRAASRFALTARDADVEGGLSKAFGALSDVMEQCVACHAAYKVH